MEKKQEEDKLNQAMQEIRSRDKRFGPHFSDAYVKAIAKQEAITGRGTYKHVKNRRDPRFVEVFKPRFNPFLDRYE